MGDRVEASALVVGRDPEVLRRLQRSVAGLRRMVDGGWFGVHEDTVGMEVEFDLVDVITGESGTGKTTLLGSVGQLWPFTTGTVRCPVGENATMFLSLALCAAG